MSCCSSCPRPWCRMLRLESARSWSGPTSWLLRSPSASPAAPTGRTLSTSRDPRSLRIGLTGGIASGKSLVAQGFRELGAAVVDADAIAREVTAPGGAAYQGVVEAFGRSILREDGTIDRKALAARVFADASARLRLNALTHPHIRRRMAEEAARLDRKSVV